MNPPTYIAQSLQLSLPQGIMLSFILNSQNKLWTKYHKNTIITNLPTSIKPNKLLIFSKKLPDMKGHILSEAEYKISNLISNQCRFLKVGS